MNLITDRTEADVFESKRLNRMKYDDMTQEEINRYNSNKGSYQHTDLNRVGQACAEMYAALTAAGYAVPGYVALLTNWTAIKRPTVAQLDQYIATITAIKNALPTTTAVPATWKNLNIEGANNIEKMLLEVEDMLARITAIYPKCGVYEAGAVMYVNECAVRYQLVEYLISTKGITITSTKLTNNSEIRAMVYRPSSAIAQYVYQADSGSSLSTNFTAYTSNGSATANWRFGNTTASVAIPMGAWHETKQNKNGVWIDGSKVASYASVSAFTSTNSLTIHGTASSANMRIAWLERYENGVFAARYLPVHDLVDDVYGWVDTSDGSFYTNPDATITAGGEI